MKWKDKLRYRFDEWMAKGMISMIRVLVIFTILVIFVIGAFVLAGMSAGEKDAVRAFWDAFAYTVNSWIPNAGDFDEKSMLIPYAAAGVIGLLITSTLIGVLSAGIQEKLENLRKGNSRVLEKDHIIVLGFTRGEYTLLNQLAEGCQNQQTVILVADDMDRVEMENTLRESVERPKNVHFISRNVTITDPHSLEICSPAGAKAIVINVKDDHKVLKTLLAVTSLIDEDAEKKPVIIATGSGDDCRLPERMCQTYNIHLLETYDVLARLIARSCRHPGLSLAFEELFSYTGSEFYLQTSDDYEGKTFAEVMEHTIDGTPAGILHHGEWSLCPNGNTIIQKGDQILFLEEDNHPVKYVPEHSCILINQKPKPEKSKNNKVTIIGINEVIETVLEELPEDMKEVQIASLYPIERLQIEKLRHTFPDLEISLFEKDMRKDENLNQLAKDAKRIVLLSRHHIDAETSDINNMHFILRLHELRQKYKYKYSIIAEMRTEANKNLIADTDHADFIVASDITAMLMAQLVNQPILASIFKELLSKEGNELYMKSAGTFGCAHVSCTFGSIRLSGLQENMIVLGWRKIRDNQITVYLNPSADEVVNMNPGDCLIVIGKYGPDQAVP